MNRTIAVGVLLTLFVHLSGCATWTVSRSQLEELKGKKVRLTTSAGTHEAGKLIGIDSLGTAVLHRKWWQSNIAIDTVTISKVETRKFSAGRTAALIPLFVVAFAIEMSILSRAMWED